MAVDIVPEGEVPEGWCHVFDGLDGHDRPVSLVHEDTPPLRRMAVFDVLVNNADRKGGHVLAMPDGHRYGVDHGVTFHTDHKLRTVLWGWLGRPADRRRAGRDRAGSASAWRGDLGDAAAPAAHGAGGGGVRPTVRPAARDRRDARTRAATGPAIPWPPF